MTFDWSQHDEKLRHLWLFEGKSSSQIAAIFKVTRNAVIGRIHRNGWSRPRPGDIKRIETRMANRKLADAAPTPPKAPEPPPRPRAFSRPPAMIEPLQPAPPDPAPKKPIDLMALTSRTCRWPFGTPGTDAFGFCGHRTEEGKTYCARHTAMAFVPVEKRKNRRAA